MNSRFLVLLLLTLPVFCVTGKEVDQKDAQQIAVNFFYERITQYEILAYQDIRITGVFVKTDPYKSLYYIFNIHPKGWICVSADDLTHPIPAYSLEGSFTEENQAPQFVAWMKQYEDQIRYATDQQTEPYPGTAGEWARLRTNDPSSLKSFKNQRNISPLITSNWNQNAPYNESCPADPAGPGGHAYAGCVPVAMGQVMYYYRWPEQGTGSYAYNCPPYGTLSANFDTSYFWDHMTNEISSSNSSLATLLYHLGVSCDLVYGPSGSGMYNHKAAYSLRTYFKYSPETEYVYRDSTTMNWDSILIAHLDRHMPMYYAGWSVPNVNGHAFVCDGYQGSDYFHFNFGWSGSSNGYFYTNNLTPGGNNFNLAQEVIINCFPDTVNYNYPDYCTGSQTLPYNMGSIDDGSGPNYAYQPNTNCSWLIDPQTALDSISSITLQFSKFTTNPTDSVIIYDGGTTGSPILGSFSGNDLPDELTSSGNQLLITFTSLTGSSNQGWLATYTTEVPVWCSGTTVITADSSVVTDGSFQFDYHNSTICKWRIIPEGGGPVTLTFLSFDTEPENDVLQIYDLATTNLLAEISGHYSSSNLPDPVTCQSGQLFLIFTTNNTITAPGWTLSYPEGYTSRNDSEANIDLTLYPNPAHDQITIRFNVLNDSPMQIRIYSIDGRTIFSEDIHCTKGINNTTLNIADFSPGIYILKVWTENGIQSKKLMAQ